MPFEAGRRLGPYEIIDQLGVGGMGEVTKPQYAVSRDGRFLLNTAIESASAPIVVSVNWMKKLEK